METEIIPREFPAPIEINPPAQIPEKDLNFLPTLDSVKTSKEVMEKIDGHFTREGRPGSAEYLKLYYMSYLLEEQYKTLRDGGTLPQETMTIIDTVTTTSEMLKDGKAVLKNEGAAEFLGGFNRLKHHTKIHMDRTIRNTSEYYSKKWLRNETLREKIDSLLGKKEPVVEPYLQISDTEKGGLYEVLDRKFIGKEEPQKEIQRNLEQMIRNRPKMVGLEFSSSFLRNINNIAETIKTGGKEATDLKKLTGLSQNMEYHGMRELGIHRDFGKKIKAAVQRDLHPQ